MDAQMKQGKGIFICYRREDAEDLAVFLKHRLSSDFGAANVFMDIDGIPFGHDFREHIMETLSGCKIVLPLVGPDWLLPHQQQAEGHH